MKLKTCPLCGSRRVRQTIEPYVTRRRGRKVLVPALEIHRCEACGEGFLTNEAMKAIESHARGRRAA